MTVRTPRWTKQWSAGIRVWIEREGEAVLGQGRADLLAAIDRCHSIRTAAKDLGISYRHAWLMVQAMNQTAGQALVESATGGVGGGGARLTDWGRDVLTVFHQLDGELHKAAAAVLPRILNVPRDASACLHLAAAISLQEVVGQLLAEYALLRPTSPVHAVFGASNELASYALAGAPVDLFLSADREHFERLQSAGKASVKPAVPLARNGLAVIAGVDCKLAIRKPADLLTASVDRIALAGPEVPLGKCSKVFLERLGLYDQFQARAVIVDNSRGVLAAIRAQRATVGVAFSSDAASAADMRTLFRPKSADATVEYSAAMLADKPRAAEAQDLLDFLASPAARRRFRSCGFAAIG